MRENYHFTLNSKQLQTLNLFPDHSIDQDLSCCLKKAVIFKYLITESGNVMSRY